MVLKQAFNALTRLHSRAATLKRLGSPDIYSPVRITPSNYFRYLEGPSQTVIHGREFLIPIDTMKGHATQLITFDGVPTDGSFTLSYNSIPSATIAFDDVAADVESALQGIAVIGNVTVTGNFTDGFLVTFIGVSSPLTLVLAGDVDFDVEAEIEQSEFVPWSPRLKRADKIIDTVYGHLAIDEIIEVVDIGGEIMGWRIRCE